MKLTRERIEYAKEEIRQRLKLSQVVEYYTGAKLSKGKMLCPFHTEKTPSFIVTEKTGLYYCQGCGAGGDVFNFVMQYCGVKFIDAIKQLDNDFGLLVLGEKITVASQIKVRQRKREQEERERLEVENNALYGRLCNEYLITRRLLSRLEPLTETWGDYITRIAWLEYEMDKAM